MVIEARLADGRTLEFPDGTDPAVIQRTVKKTLGIVDETASPVEPPQERATGGRSGRGAQLQEERLAEREQFLASLPPERRELLESVTPQEAVLIGAGRGVTTVGRGLGLVEPEDPTSKQAVEQLGQIDPGVAAGEFVGEAAPFLLPGGAAGFVTGKIARPAAQAILGAVEAGVLTRGKGEDIRQVIKTAGIGGAAAVVLEVGIPVVGRAAGSLFRKITGKAPEAPLINPDGSPTDELTSALDQEGIEFDDFVTDAAKTAQAPTAGQLREFAGEADLDPEVLAAAQRLGLEESLPASVFARNEQFIEFEQGLTGIIGSQLSASQKDAIKKTVQKADDFITDFGGTLDKAALNDRIGTQITQNIENLRTQARESYDVLAEAIPARTPINTRLITESVEQTARDVGGIENLDSLDKRLLKLTEGTPTYGLIDRERKKIVGQLEGIDRPFPNATTFELNNALDVLTEVQGSAAREVGAEDLWNTAKSLVFKRKQLEKEAISNLGRDQTRAILPALGAGLKDLAKGDVQKFNKTFSGIPENLREEAIFTAMNDVFTAGGRSQAQMSMPGFSAWWDKLGKTPTAKNALLKKMPKDARNRLTDIATVTKAFARATAETARTGRIQTLLNDFDKPNGMVSKLYGIARVGGRVSPTAAAATSAVVDALAKGKVPTAKAADNLLSSPQFRRLVIAEAGSPNSPAASTAREQLRKTKAFKEWIETLPQRSRSTILTVGMVPWLLSEEEQ